MNLILSKVNLLIFLSIVLLFVIISIWHICVLLDIFWIQIILTTIVIWRHSFWLENFYLGGHLGRVHRWLKWPCWYIKATITWIFFYLDKWFIINLINYLAIQFCIWIATNSRLCFLNPLNIFLILSIFIFYQLGILMVHLRLINFRKDLK